MERSLKERKTEVGCKSHKEYSTVIKKKIKRGQNVNQDQFTACLGSLK